MLEKFSNIKMSSCLRNLKFSAHQSYLSLKPGIFRTLSCATIGVYSCVDVARSSNGSSLLLSLSGVNEQKKASGNNGHDEMLHSHTDLCYEIHKNRFQKLSGTASRNSETKSALSVYRLPPDLLGNIMHSSLYDAVSISMLSSNNAYLCNQLRKDNVTIFSGFLEALPYHMFCIGAENRVRLAVAPLSELESRAVKFAEMPGTSPDPKSFPGKPSEEQLQHVFMALADCLPKFFKRPHNYSIYHKDVVFENNIRGVCTRGIAAYVRQFAFTRVLASLCYAHVYLEILKMTRHPEDGTIRVRWRIAGISGMRVIFMFWKIRIWQWKKMIENQSEWTDGFSVFHVGADGKIFKHVCDKMMPDDNREPVKTREGGMAVKLAMIMGMMPDYSFFGGLEDGAVVPMTSTDTF